MAKNFRGFEVIKEYKDKSIVMPERKTLKSAGYDISSAETYILEPKTCYLIPTGLKAYMLDNEFLSLYIRSSMAIKHNLSLTNSVAIIDSDYYNNPDNEGHIMIGIRNNSDEPFLLEKGTRIAQGVFMSYGIIDGDKSYQTRVGGIGSTGLGK